MNTNFSHAELQECISPLRKFAFVLTRDSERADDLVQDCLERALVKADLFDGSNLRSWLFTMCKRVFLNQLRKTKSQGVAVPAEDAPQSKLALKPDQDMKMHARDVADCFRKLPGRDQKILALVTIEGLKYEEVAAVLDVPVGTVRSRLSRARTRLRALTEHDETGTEAAAAV